MIMVGAYGCSGILDDILNPTISAYINTQEFIDDRRVIIPTPDFQVVLTPFEDQRPDQTRIGTKRVGTNFFKSPILATTMVSEVVQQSVITQLRLHRIAAGPSNLQLRGSLREFFVDVDVDPATGKGTFTARTDVELVVWDTTTKRRLWSQTYKGKATTVGSSVIDDHYARALKLAFTNLLNHIRQDPSILELKVAYVTPDQLHPPDQTLVTKKLPTVPADTGPQPRPSPMPTPLPDTSPIPSDVTAPRLVFLHPDVAEGADPITTTTLTMPLIGLVASESGITQVQVNGATVQMTTASDQEMQKWSLMGNGIRKFHGSAFLTIGMNKIEVRVSDRHGNWTTQEIRVLRRAVVDQTKPRLVLVEPQLTRDMRITATTMKQRIVGLAADESGIGEVQIDGITAQMTDASAQELEAAGLPGRGVKFTGTAMLHMGDNPIEIITADLRGNETKRIFTIRREEGGRETHNISTYYTRRVAVVIGINAYQHWSPLEYAVNDARSMKKRLRALKFDKVIELLDEDATRKQILNLLGTRLPQLVTKNDQVVIFFAGHGQTEVLADGSQMGYIIPVDASVEDYFSTAISMETMRTVARRLPAKHILYAIDACYSGLLIRRGAGISSVPRDRRIETYLRGKTTSRAIQVITAGRKGEQVVEEGGHGLFTKYLLRGLEGEADKDGDRAVTAMELGYYLNSQVSIASDNRQTPQYGQMDGEGDNVFLY